MCHVEGSETIKWDNLSLQTSDMSFRLSFLLCFVFALFPLSRRKCRLLYLMGTEHERRQLVSGQNHLQVHEGRSNINESNAVTIQIVN